MSTWSLNRYARAIARGAVFGYPTDTIWGFGCHPLIESSVMQILAIKRRPVEKGLILLSSRLEYCRDYIDVDEAGLALIAQPVEQPTTWLVDASKYCPDWISGQYPTVAIRITDHPLMRDLCKRIQAPLVSTSANRSGRPPARNLIQMRRQFSTELDFVISGFSTGGAHASRIKSLASGDIVRSGG